MLLRPLVYKTEVESPIRAIFKREHICTTIVFMIVMTMQIYFSINVSFTAMVLLMPTILTSIGVEETGTMLYIDLAV